MLPTPTFDLHVGQCIRERRLILGMSQQSLGKELGVSFQQIQKYEKGLNAINANKLYKLAQILHVPTAYFFPDSKKPAESKNDISDRECLELVKAFSAIEDRNIRKRVADLIRNIAHPGDA